MKDPLLGPLAGSGTPWRGPSDVASAPVRPRRRTPTSTVVAAAALVVGLGVQLLPLVVFPTVLSQDGPAHVAGAWVLLHSGDGDAIGALLREHYRTDLTPVPNMLSTLLLAALIPVAGPDGAERLLVAGLVVGLVAALGYAVRAVDRRAWWLAATALPLAGSKLVAYGFDNFVLGVVGTLLVLGVALRRRAGWRTPVTAGLAALLVLTWTAHLLPWAVAAGSVLLLGLVRVRYGVRAGDRVRDAVRRDALPVLLALAPSVVLTLLYLASGEGPPAEGEGGPSPGRVAALLTGFRPYVTGWGQERVPALVIALVLVTLAVAALRRVRPDVSVLRPERLALGLLLGGATVAYLLTPGRLGEDFGFLADRLAWFPPLLLVLWAATRLPGPRIAAAATVLLVAATSAGALSRLPTQSAATAEVAELLSLADAIPPASTLVVLQYDRSVASSGPGWPDPLRHESSRLAVRVGGVDVGHYEAVEDYFQVRFTDSPGLRRRLDTDPDLHGLERIPPAVDLARVRGDLDYVVVLGLDRASAAVRRSERTRAVTAELVAHYTRVATSVTGLAILWRADRGSGQTADGGPADSAREQPAAAVP